MFMIMLRLFLITWSFQLKILFWVKVAVLRFVQVKQANPILLYMDSHIFLHKNFQIAQGRLGPGRIHHCMRTIGVAEVALQAIIHRAKNRYAFGAPLSEKEAIRRAVAEARIEITQMRQLCYLAAVVADEKGFKDARKYIAMIKVAAPRAALKIVDEAIQIHGAHGLSQDSKLTEAYTGLRTLRVADGPDSVHLASISTLEFAAEPSLMGMIASGENKNIKKYGMFDEIKHQKKERKAKL